MSRRDVPVASAAGAVALALVKAKRPFGEIEKEPPE